MRAPMMQTGLALLLAVGGCGGGSSSNDAGARDLAAAFDLAGDGSAAVDGSGVDGASVDAATDAISLPCPQTLSSNLPNVTLRFSDQRCTFTLAQARGGIALRYEIEISADVPGVITLPQDGGRCDLPGPSGLILFERLTGNGLTYCICDRGHCLPPAETPITLRQGRFLGAFSWNGVEWMGPSDTGNEPGPPFPPGTYTLHVGAKGRYREAGAAERAYEVGVDMPIHLVP